MAPFPPDVSALPTPQMSVARRTAVAVMLAAVSLACPRLASVAQEVEPPPPGRTVSTTAVFGTNVVLGGLTAATRALLTRHDPVRAFALGALGGAVHFSGKLVGPRWGLPGGVTGLALSSTGSATISNARRGAGLLDELYLPAGPVRVRYARREPRSVRRAINA